LNKWPTPVQHRREHEQAPDSEDDAGNRRQEFHRDPDRALEHGRAQLGQEQRDAESGGYGKQHGDQRSDHRSVDRRQRTELIGDRIPDLAGDEGKSKVRQRRPGAAQERDGHSAQNQQHQQRRNESGRAENSLEEQLPCSVPRIYDRHDVSSVPA
jgi:hypothetical protein